MVSAELFSGLLISSMPGRVPDTNLGSTAHSSRGMSSFPSRVLQVNGALVIQLGDWIPIPTASTANAGVQGSFGDHFIKCTGKMHHSLFQGQ